MERGFAVSLDWRAFKRYLHRRLRKGIIIYELRRQDLEIEKGAGILRGKLELGDNALCWTGRVWSWSSRGVGGFGLVAVTT